MGRYLSPTKVTTTSPHPSASLVSPRHLPLTTGDRYDVADDAEARAQIAEARTWANMERTGSSIPAAPTLSERVVEQARKERADQQRHVEREALLARLQADVSLLSQRNEHLMETNQSAALQSEALAAEVARLQAEHAAVVAELRAQTAASQEEAARATSQLRDPAWVVRQNQALVATLENERVSAVSAEEKASMLQITLEEERLEWELERERLKTEVARLRGERRRAHVGPDGEEAIWEEMERAVAGAQAERDKAQAENRRLRLAAGGEHGDHRHEGPGLNPWQSKVEVLRREVQRSEHARGRLQAEVDGLKKAQRSMLVNKRQAVAGHARVRELQSRLEAREKELVERGLAVREAEASAEDVGDQLRRTREHLDHMALENKEQRQDIKALREQVLMLKMELTEERGGASRVAISGEGPPRGESRALELLKQLQNHIPRFSRGEEIADRLVSELNVLQRQRVAMQERERSLMGLAALGVEAGTAARAAKDELPATREEILPLRMATPHRQTLLRYAGNGLDAVVDRS